MPEKTSGNNYRFRIFLSLSIIYAIVIYYLSSQSNPGDQLSSLRFLDIKELENIIRTIEHYDWRYLFYPFYALIKYPDKVQHMILYAGFGFLLYFTFRNSSDSLFIKYAFWFSLIIGIAYGASDELHQSFVPGRSASLWDLTADLAGVLFALTVIFIKEKLYLRYRNFSIYKSRD